MCLEKIVTMITKIKNPDHLPNERLHHTITLEVVTLESDGVIPTDIVNPP
jgi:hypothetical protein